MSGFGRSLQEARRRKGFTLEEVERETRIRKRYLVALEQDEYDQLPPPVYAVGYIRVYARFLDLDSAPLVEQFAEAAGIPAAPVTRRQNVALDRWYSAAARESSSATSALLVVIVAAAIILAGSRLKDPITTALSGFTDNGAPQVTVAQAQLQPTDQTDPASKSTTTPKPLTTAGDAAGGGDRVPPSTDSAPRLVMTPPWFREAAAEADAKTASVISPMPQTVGQPVETARVSLEKLGLRVATEGWASGVVPRGVVLWQQPEAGAALQKGQLALLAVSKGPKMATVPELVGKPQEDALRALRQAGLVNPPYVHFQGPKDLSPTVLNRVCNGCVLSVSPPPGSESSPDSIIAIAVRKVPATE